MYVNAFSMSVISTVRVEKGFTHSFRLFVSNLGHPGSHCFIACSSGMQNGYSGFVEESRMLAFNFRVIYGPLVLVIASCLVRPWEFTIQPNGLLACGRLVNMLQTRELAHTYKMGMRRSLAVGFRHGAWLLCLKGILAPPPTFDRKEIAQARR